MKNFGLFILGVILGVLTMYFYFNKNQDMTTETPIKPPSGIITPEQIRTLDQAYNQRYQIINDSLFKGSGEEDNRSSWYKLEDIESYIAYAKQQAKDNGYTLDGLRLYLGAHPDVNDKKGLTTLFFVPTGFKNTSEGSIFSLQKSSGDIPSGNGLDLGGGGMPPSINYPQ